MSNPTNRDLKVIYDTICRAQQVRKESPSELKDLFTPDSHLIITPSNFCCCDCLHCVADSTPHGGMMSYSYFAAIDPRFIQIFSSADFGRRGNPLLYHSHGHDLVDILQSLNEKGIKKFTLALTLQTSPLHVLERLENFVQSQPVTIETMVTYHHYFKDLDPLQLAHNFNATLKNYLPFSQKILISLLGDKYSQQQPTKAEEVEQAFKENFEIILADLQPAKVDSKNYSVRHQGKEAKLYIPSIDTRVYPFGRFKNYLDQRGILAEYTQKLEQSLGNYACPDF